LTPAGAAGAVRAFSQPLGVPEIVDCWNQTGVSGDGTCPELPKHGHCRNCPVYSAAGSRLLDQQLPADYRREWTVHLARKRTPGAPVKQSAVLFRIGPEWLALPTRSFQEVAEPRPVHSLPHRRQGVVLGIINVRGQLLICVSLSRLLGLETESGAARSSGVGARLVVAEWQGKLLAFPVDEVHGIYRYHASELRPPPATLAEAGVNFTRDLLVWRDKFAACLDEETLFASLNRSLA
jgi:chemotaxis-related protein WspD